MKELQYHAKPDKPDPLFAKSCKRYLEDSSGKYQ
ncbi:hypothetical protein PO124_14395 [Bacillus licheniformis]|nr:hypothetical protein [Bacillus licheniformis]